MDKCRVAALYLLCFMMGLLCAEQPSTIHITPESEYHAMVDSFVPQPWQITTISLDADIHYDRDEFDYLTDLHEGTLVTAPLLKKAIAYLLKKDIFSSITLKRMPSTAGNHLAITLHGFWAFAGLKIHGMVLGKDQYRAHYLIEPGKPFDEATHELSVEKMRQACVQEGYASAHVTSDLDYDEITKTVTAHARLKLGSRYTIGAVNVHMQGIDPDAHSALHHELQACFFKKISREYYRKMSLNNHMITLKRFLAKKGYVHIGITLDEQMNHLRKEVDVTFTIDLMRKKKLLFIGNHQCTDDQLMDVVLMFGRSIALISPEIVQQELERFYRSQGFWHICLQAREEDDAYIFTINEGVRATITCVTLKKVTYVDAHDTAKQLFAQCIDQPHYNQETVNQACEALLAWYVGLGFLDAAIIKQEYLPITQHSAQHELVLTVDEGSRAYVDTICVPVWPDVEQQGPFLACKQSTQPVPFTMALMHEQQEWLLKYGAQQGYKDVQIVPRVTRAADRVQLVWQVNIPTLQPKFGKTVLVGATTFPFAYIKRELTYQQGGWWDRAQVRNSLVALKTLTPFESVALYPDHELIDDERPMLLKVHEDDPFEVRARVGCAVQQVSKFLSTAGLTYRVGGSCIYKNPTNHGDKLSIDIDVDRSQRSFAVQYAYPWLFNVPITTIFEGYDNKYQQPGLIGTKKNLYEIFQQGFLVNMTYKTVHADLGCSWGIELMETTLREEDAHLSRLRAAQLARAINFEPQLLHKKIPYVQCEPTILVDFLDHKLQPTHGSFTLLTLKGMLPFGPVGLNSGFVRMLLEHSRFFPLKSTVLGMRVRFGHIFHRLLKAVMPTERFYLGGANSIRSYETDRCPPLGVFVEDGCPPQHVPQGGKTLFNLNVELRFPIARQISGVLFQDLGALAGDRWQDCFERPILAGSGFGVRYATPIGPLRFDIAFKWHKSYPQELRYAWFLSFGQAF